MINHFYYKTVSIQRMNSQLSTCVRQNNKTQNKYSKIQKDHQTIYNQIPQIFRNNTRNYLISAQQIYNQTGLKSTNRKKINTSLSKVYNKESKKELLDQFIVQIKNQLQFQKLSNLTLQQIEINQNHLNILNQAIFENTSLIKLQISECHITDYQLNLLTRGIQNSQIQYLNLSHNRLNNPTAISKIITFQSLKYNKLENNRLLIDINLSYNYITSSFIEDFKEVMQKPNNLKNLNFKNNLLNKKSIKMLIKLIQIQKNIIYFDIRENKGINKKLLDKILNLLKNNIEYQKKQIALQSKCKINFSFESSDQFNERNSIQINIHQDLNKSQKKQSQVRFRKISKSLNKSLQTFSKINHQRNQYNKLNQSSIQAMKNQQNKERICQNCIDLEKKLLISQQNNMNYMYENHKLKNAFKQTQDFHSNLMNSLSMIQIGEDNHEEFKAKAQPESFQQINNLSNINHQQLMQQEDKLEYFMRELTQMMDYIENQNYTNQYTQVTLLKSFFKIPQRKPEKLPRNS